MNLEDAARSLRSVRKYSPAPIPPHILRWIVDIAHLAPSARNGQPWRFAVITARHHLTELSEVGRPGGGAAHLAGAAAAVAITATIPDCQDRDSLLLDLGQATYALQLAAVDAGIGSCLARVFDHDKTRQLLHLDSDQFCPYILALGEPAGERPFTPRRSPNRRPLDEVVRFMPH